MSARPTPGRPEPDRPAARPAPARPVDALSTEVRDSLLLLGLFLAGTAVLAGAAALLFGLLG